MKKSLLYLSSYVPLYIVLILKEVITKAMKQFEILGKVDITQVKWFNHFDDWAIIVLFGLSLLSIFMLRYTLDNSKKLVQQDYKILEIENKTADYYFEYVGLYFLPCIGLSIGNPVDCFVMVSIIGILGVVYVSNELMYINPVLTLFGYKVFAVELAAAGTNSDVKISKVIITDCENPMGLIGEKVKMIVADTKYTMVLKKDQTGSVSKSD